MDESHKDAYPIDKIHILKQNHDWILELKFSNSTNIDDLDDNEWKIKWRNISMIHTSWLTPCANHSGKDVAI